MTAALIGGAIVAALWVVAALLFVAIATDFHDGGLDAAEDNQPTEGTK
jgi:hypothetical protein